jgi:alanine dehydrogenase
MPTILNEHDFKQLYQTPAAMDELLILIEDSFKAHNRDEVAGQVRVETSLVDAKRKYRIMTAAVPGAGLGVRISALFRGAKHAYFHLLFDNESGDLLALVAGRELNPWRTGAPAGVAARHLAPTNAKTLGVLGSGRQAHGQLIAICRAQPSLELVRIFSPTEAHRTAFAREMSAALGVEVAAVNSAHEALKDADIVSLATSSRTPVLQSDWIRPGALVVSITSGQLPQDLIARSRVVVSWKEEVLGGEAPRQPYISMIEAGVWSADNIAGELGEVVLGRRRARQTDRETVIFECVGMPLWDTTAAVWAYQWAKKNGVGTFFSLE